MPDTTPLHPTPVYEFLVALVIFAVLWRRRRAAKRDGGVFAAYLTLSGGARFVVELIRINPPIVFGLSEPQLVSAGLVVAGTVAWSRLARPVASLVPVARKSSPDRPDE